MVIAPLPAGPGAGAGEEIPPPPPVAAAVGDIEEARIGTCAASCSVVFRSGFLDSWFFCLDLSKKTLGLLYSFSRSSHIVVGFFLAVFESKWPFLSSLL